MNSWSSAAKVGAAHLMLPRVTHSSVNGFTSFVVCFVELLLQLRDAPASAQYLTQIRAQVSVGLVSHACCRCACHAWVCPRYTLWQHDV